MLKLLKKSRKKPKPGDIFTLKIDDTYFWGRVIKNDAVVFEEVKSYLIYIYNVTTKNKDKVPQLDKSNLLLKPVIVANVPWLWGYFETVDHKELDKKDMFEQHCFEHDIPTVPTFLDEYGNQLSKKVEPCSRFTLGAHGSVYYDICMELGIPSGEEEDAFEK